MLNRLNDIVKDRLHYLFSSLRRAFGGRRSTASPSAFVLRAGLGVALWAALLGFQEGSARCAAAAEDRAKTNVRVGRPTQTDLTREISLPGILDPFMKATLYAKSAGYLKELHVDIGDLVKKGDVLALIDAPELGQDLLKAKAMSEAAQADLALAQAEETAARAALTAARAKIDSAKAAIEKAVTLRALRELTLKRHLGLSRDGAITEQDLDETRSAAKEAEADRAVAEAALSSVKADALRQEASVKVAEAKVSVARSRKEIARTEAERARILENYTKILAPFSGVVTQRLVWPGDFIRNAGGGQGTALLVVESKDRLRLRLQVPESDVAGVHVGGSMRVVLDALAMEFPLQVTRTAGALNQKTRTMTVEAEMDNLDGRLLPGMSALVSLQIDERKGAITIPATAVVMAGKKPSVWVVQKGQARRKPIQIGLDDGIRVEVVEGLDGSEDVVLSGQQLLREGSLVQVLVQANAP